MTDFTDQTKKRGRKRLLSPSRVERIRRDERAIHLIAKQYDVSVSTIRRALRHAGALAPVKTVKRTKRHTDAEERLIAHEIQSSRKTAREWGISKTVVCELRAKYGYKEYKRAVLRGERLPITAGEPYEAPEPNIWKDGNSDG